jgi:hypothetical protein
MMNAITKEIYLEASIAHVTGENESESSRQKRVIEQAVSDKLDNLDNSFINILDCYISGAMDQNEPDIANLLLNIRDEIMMQLQHSMPDEARVLTRVADILDTAQRRAILGEYVQQQQQQQQQKQKQKQTTSSLSSSPLETLASTVDSIINDMEANLDVPDRSLLARMCLIREEINNMMIQDAQPLYATMVAVPQKTVAFLKELLQVDDPKVRQAYLEKAFLTDWDWVTSSHVTSAQRQQGPESSGESSSGGTDREEEKEEKEEEKEKEYETGAVRPGRFMTCLGAIQHEMARDTTVSSSNSMTRDIDATLAKLAGKKVLKIDPSSAGRVTSSSSSNNNNNNNNNEQVLKRLEEVKADAIETLTKISCSPL